MSADCEQARDLMSAFPSSRRVYSWLPWKRLFQALAGKAASGCWPTSSARTRLCGRPATRVRTAFSQAPQTWCARLQGTSPETIAAGWLGWTIYDMHEEQVAIEQIQRKQRLSGQRVESAD
jgi:hypothetical protein